MEIRIVASEGAPTLHEAVDDCLGNMADQLGDMLVAHNKGARRKLVELKSKMRLELMRLDFLVEEDLKTKADEV